MTGITRTIESLPDDRIHVSLAAHAQGFRYDITLYMPNGAGGFSDGQVVGSGENAHTQWIGIGSAVAGALAKVCVASSGGLPSRNEIVVRLQLERESGLFEDLHIWRIAPGLPAGDYKCLTMQFR